MCKCRGKKKASASEATPKIVNLQMKSSIKLPIRFPEKVDDKVVIVMPNRKMRGPANATVIYGSNGLVPEPIRENLVQQWPHAFMN